MGAFFSAIKLTLDNNRVPVALAAWVDVKEEIDDWVGGEPEWARRAMEMWRGYFTGISPSKRKKGKCPCGKVGKGELGVHFLKEHGVDREVEKVKGKRKRVGSDTGAVDNKKKKR